MIILSRRVMGKLRYHYKQEEMVWISDNPDAVKGEGGRTFSDVAGPPPHESAKKSLNVFLIHNRWGWMLQGGNQTIKRISYPL